jgi:hypothetical protein
VAKRHLRLVTPGIQKRTVIPRRRPNGDIRTREYLTEAEVERLMKAATDNRHGHRDVTITATERFVSSLASIGNRLYWTSAQRYSTIIFWPSI